MATVLITGANRGIGLEFCRQYRERGDAVIGTCREANEALAALDVEVVEGLDVTSASALTALRARIDRPIDVLVNNAGILGRDEIDALDFDSLRRQFEVNSLGPLRTTSALLDALAPNAKVAMVTSRMGSITDNTSGGSYGYRMSKAALNAASVSLARDLRGRGIAIAVLHPGYVRTDMTGQAGNLDPDASVRGMIERIDELTLESSGTFWLSSGEILPW